MKVEIKNPLTPLKLSLESLSLLENKETEDDIKSALISLKDIENILINFKDLVNIEYKPLNNFDFINFYNELNLQLSKSYEEFAINCSFNSLSIIINSEANLLKMLILNLVNNGLEANSDGFRMLIEEKSQSLEISFITENCKILDIDRCFILGFSQKGKNRGYGLFLCKKISEYLDIAISGENISNNVVFTLRIKVEDLND